MSEESNLIVSFPWDKSTVDILDRIGFPLFILVKIYCLRSYRKKIASERTATGSWFCRFSSLRFLSSSL